MKTRYISTMLGISLLLNGVMVSGAENKIFFEENKGQVMDQNYQLRHDVLFSGRSQGFVFHIRTNGISIQLYQAESMKNQKKVGFEGIEENPAVQAPHETLIYRVDLDWIGANENFTVVRGPLLSDYNHYYNVPEGNKPALFVRKYESVLLKNIYDGVHLYFYERDGVLETDWIVDRAADYEKIAFKVSGAEMSVDNDGYLIMKTPIGEIREGKLKVFQGSRAVEAQWTIFDEIVGFHIKGYDPELPLRIDPPVRIWGTYYGSGYYMYQFAATVDHAGNVFLAGSTINTTNIATTGAHQVVHGGGSFDAFIAKFNPLGMRLWGTYYGGSDEDCFNSCAADSAGNIYAAGSTGSVSNISTPGAHQVTYAGSQGSSGSAEGDAMLVKFNSNGVRQWATYYGGLQPESGKACAVDGSGNIYLAGWTGSAVNISTPGVHQETFGGLRDGFVAKFNSNGVRLWGTYYGGGPQDYGTYCAADSDGNVFLTGYTMSTSDIATAGAHQTTMGGGGYDAFLVKLNSNGIRQWGTFCGGTDNDWAYSCAVDGTGNVFIAGWTYSQNQITSPGSHQENYGGGTQPNGGDAFLVKFNTNGVRQWGTYYGGSFAEQGFSCSADSSGNVFLCGICNISGAISTPGAHQVNHGGSSNDGFLVKFNENGVRQWGTYYGGSSWDEGNSCAVDPTSDCVYMTGLTHSDDNISTSGAHQTLVGSPGSAFLVKMCDTPIQPGDIVGDTIVCAGATVTYSVPNDPLVVQYIWSLPQGWTGTSSTNTITVTANNTGGTISVTADYGFFMSVPQQLTVTVFMIPAQEICYTGVDSATGMNKIFWSSTLPPDVQLVNIFRENPQSVWEQIATASPGTNSFTDTTADPGSQAYSYKISVNDIFGCQSEHSQTHSTVFLEASYNSSDDFYTFTWTPYEGIIVSEYVLSGTDANNILYQIGTIPGGTHFFNYHSPDPALQKFVITYEALDCNTSNPVLLYSNFVPYAFVNVDEYAMPDILFFPNPASDQLFIQLNQPACVLVMSILGDQILSSPEAKYHKLDISTLAQGVYILKAATQARMFIKL
jgi:hypothetical protein